MTKPWWRWLALAGVLFLGTVKPVAAATATATIQGVVMTPSYSEVVLNKDEKEKSVEISYTNNLPVAISLRLSVMDFGNLDESGGVAFWGIKTKKGDQQKYALASWLSLESDHLEVAAGATQKVEVTVLNKESLGAGGHYGAVIAQVETQEPVKGVVGVNQSLASLLLVKKTGGEVYSLKLDKISDKKGSWRLPINEIELRFLNSGNVHVIPRGVVAVTDPWGRQVEQGIINTDSAIILPESYRQLVVRPLPTARALVPGLYTLTVNYRYDGSNQWEQAQQKFWWSGIGGVVVLGLVVVLGMVLVLRILRR